MKNKTIEALFDGDRTKYRQVTCFNGPNDSEITLIQPATTTELFMIQEYSGDNGFDVYQQVEGNSIAACRQAFGLIKAV